MSVREPSHVMSFSNVTSFFIIIIHLRFELEEKRTINPHDNNDDNNNFPFVSSLNLLGSLLSRLLDVSYFSPLTSLYSGNKFYTLGSFGSLLSRFLHISYSALLTSFVPNSLPLGYRAWCPVF